MIPLIVYSNYYINILFHIFNSNNARHLCYFSDISSILSALGENNKQITNNSITNSKSITFDFHRGDSNPYSNVLCNIYENQSNICTSPIKFNNLDHGAHTFEIYNMFIIDINANGVVSSAMFSNPVTFNWNVE